MLANLRVGWQVVLHGAGVGSGAWAGPGGWLWQRAQALFSRQYYRCSIWQLTLAKHWHGSLLDMK